MALTKECELGSKFVIEHFEIDVIHFHPQSTKAIAEVRGWKSLADKEDGAACAWQGSFEWDTGDQPQLAAASLALAEAKLSLEIDAGKIK